MDSPRPLLSAELQFFTKGTGQGESQDDLFMMIMSSAAWLGFLFFSVNQVLLPVLIRKLCLHSPIGGCLHQI